MGSIPGLGRCSRAPAWTGFEAPAPPGLDYLRGSSGTPPPGLATRPRSRASSSGLGPLLEGTDSDALLADAT